MANSIKGKGRTMCQGGRDNRRNDEGKRALERETANTIITKRFENRINEE